MGVESVAAGGSAYSATMSSGGYPQSRPPVPLSAAEPLPAALSKSSAVSTSSPARTSYRAALSTLPMSPLPAGARRPSIPPTMSSRSARRFEREPYAWHGLRQHRFQARKRRGIRHAPDRRNRRRRLLRPNEFGRYPEIRRYGGSLFGRHGKQDRRVLRRHRDAAGRCDNQHDRLLRRSGNRLFRHSQRHHNYFRRLADRPRRRHGKRHGHILGRHRICRFGRRHAEQSSAGVRRPHRHFLSCLCERWHGDHQLRRQPHDHRGHVLLYAGFGQHLHGRAYNAPAGRWLRHARLCFHGLYRRFRRLHQRHDRAFGRHAGGLFRRPRDQYRCLLRWH